MAKPTLEQKRLLERMRGKVKLLKELGYPDKKITKVVRKLNLPLGAQLRLLDTR